MTQSPRSAPQAFGRSMLTGTVAAARCLRTVPAWTQCRLMIALFLLSMLVLSACSQSVQGGPEVNTARNPVILKLRAGSFLDAIDPKADGHKKLKAKLAKKVERVARSKRGRLVALQILDLPFEYDSLSSSKRRLVRKVAGKDRNGREWYEGRVSYLHRYLVRKAQTGGRVTVSVVNLPLETAKNGGIDRAEATNARYDSLMRKLDAFVVVRNVDVAAGQADPMATIEAMPQAISRAGSRPVFYRAGSTWQVVPDASALVAEVRAAAGEESESDGDKGRRFPPILLVNQDLSDAVLPVMHEVGGQQMKIIYQWHADPNCTGIVDLDRLRKKIEPYVPEDYTGYVCMDFEDPYTYWLRQSPDDPRYIQAQKQLVAAINMAKGLRPKAKWAMWGHPHFSYNRGNAVPPADLMAVQDWFAPHIYDRFPDDEEPGVDAEREHVRTIITVTRQQAGDRPVLPYVWHRRAERSKADKFNFPTRTLLPEEELRLDVTWAIEFGAHGIVWWGGDKPLGDPPPPDDERYQHYWHWKEVYDREKPEDLTFEEHFDTLHRKILRLLRDVLDDAYESQDSDQDGGEGSDDPTGKEPAAKSRRTG